MLKKRRFCQLRILIFHPIIFLFAVWSCGSEQTPNDTSKAHTAQYLHQKPAKKTSQSLSCQQPQLDISPLEHQIIFSAAGRLHPRHLPKSAWTGHIPFVSWLISTITPSKTVELGTFHGLSLLAMAQSADMFISSETHFWGIDTWRGDKHAGKLNVDIYNRLNSIIKDYYPKSVTLLKGTFQDHVDHFQDESINLLHIDGRHFYEDVVEDFNLYLPKLSNNSVVIFHDTMVKTRDFGVWKFWHEITKKYPGRTFNFHHSHGLGVLAFGNDIPNALASFLKVTQEVHNAEQIRNYYECLHQRIITNHRK